MDFVPLASGSKPQVKASYKRERSAMNLASRVLLGVVVCNSGWADWEMAGWKLLVGTAALQHCSTTVLQYCSTAALQHCSTAALQHYSTTTLQLDSQYSDVIKQLTVET